MSDKDSLGEKNMMFKKIIETCLLDLEQNEDYIELFRPSIYHAGEVYSKQAAIEFIKTFTKNKKLRTKTLCDKKFY